MRFLLEYITSNPKETKRLIEIDYQQLKQLITEASTLGNQKQTILKKQKL